MSHHALMVAGWALAVLGAGLYVGAIAAETVRVGKQYSRAMTGSGGLRLIAALAAAGRRWYLLVPVVIGVVLLLAAR